MTAGVNALPSDTKVALAVAVQQGAMAQAYCANPTAYTGLARSEALLGGRPVMLLSVRTTARCAGFVGPVAQPDRAAVS